MTKLLSLKKGLSLAGETIADLKQAKINIPKNAQSVDVVQTANGTKYTSIYTFRNCDNYLMKRLKIDKDIQSGEEKLQARFYEYIDGVGENRKLSKVTKLNFGSDNKCKDAEFWDFYHPYYSDTVLFSRRSNSGVANNFPKTSDYIEDINGIKLRPISTAEYLETKQRMGRKHFVSAPWTIDESITSDVAVTDRIKECTVIGIIGEKGISLNHLNPNNKKNYDLAPIIETLKEQISKQGKDVKAFLLGSVEADERSNKQFWELKNALEQARIPISTYKTGDMVIKNIRAFLPPIMEFGKMVRNGRATPFSFVSGQHIICDGNEIKIANMVIDKELASGNRNAFDMLRKSFSILNNS